MTDKQIIIDGVDVSGCEHFEECETELEWSKCLADCYPYPEGTCYGYCDEHPNCYYKQLQRKEQECEELKETFDGLFKVQYKLADNNKKLRQCLTEIKEIAEINPINTCWTVLELCEKCDENKECDIQCPLFKFKLILQKISECEVDND